MMIMRSPIPSVLLLPLLLALSALGSCCLVCASGSTPAATDDAAIAEVALILDIKSDFRDRFRRMDPLEQNRVVDRAWVQARAELPPALYRELGMHRVAIGPDGWPTTAALRALGNTVQRHLRPGDDPPRGCQRDHHSDGPPGSIKCSYFLLELVLEPLPEMPGQRRLVFDLGFSINARFWPRIR